MPGNQQQIQETTLLAARVHREPQTCDSTLRTSDTETTRSCNTDQNDSESARRWTPEPSNLQTSVTTQLLSDYFKQTNTRMTKSTKPENLYLRCILSILFGKQRNREKEKQKNTCVCVCVHTHVLSRERQRERHPASCSFPSWMAEPATSLGSLLRRLGPSSHLLLPSDTSRELDQEGSIQNSNLHSNTEWCCHKQGFNPQCHNISF